MTGATPFLDLIEAERAAREHLRVVRAQRPMATPAELLAEIGVAIGPPWRPDWDDVASLYAIGWRSMARRRRQGERDRVREAAARGDRSARRVVEAAE